MQLTILVLNWIMIHAYECKWDQKCISNTSLDNVLYISFYIEVIEESILIKLRNANIPSAREIWTLIAKIGETVFATWWVMEVVSQYR